MQYVFVVRSFFHLHVCSLSFNNQFELFESHILQQKTSILLSGFACAIVSDISQLFFTEDCSCLSQLFFTEDCLPSFSKATHELLATVVFRVFTCIVTICI